MNLQAYFAAVEITRMRKKIFNKEFLEKNFQDLHEREVKEPIQPNGYPDTGNGRYSDKLSYG